MASLTFNHIKKSYGEDLTVKDFHLEVKDKEFIVLVGPSGCGKSTTLRMIAGLEEISEGELFLGDKLINHVSPKDRDIAMVFQNYALYPHMNVYQNMSFGLKLRKLPKNEIHQRVTEVARILEIEHLLNRKPKALSGGQRQRVALGRSIVRNPKVFLMDEPLSNLDAKLRTSMRTEIIKLHKKLEATIVYVTHDQTEAMTMGDRIVVMKDGEIQQVATPYDIYHSPANKYVAGFIGAPSMNFIDGTIEEINGHIKFISDGFTFMIPEEKSQELKKGYGIGKKVILGIRPENIDLSSNQDPTAIHFKVMIEVVENMGPELNLYVKKGEQSLIARVKEDIKVKAGQTISLSFHMNHAHFFDAETEKAI
ncbi:ABC transporter ATP-binding protein [Bacillus sp. 03113]|uniref:ABC transporter ATP-binding protein n=1 Tax=Bacillus sp. 03113 TaxID=2578211 RepID=UPI001143DC33|nr:sn-glycerol-3-phosphate ABC transporter ATP-binding protein UgpC [Bacillus sp. 03113]